MQVQQRAAGRPVYLLNGERGLASIAAGLPVLLCSMLDTVIGNLWTASLLGLDWRFVGDWGRKAARCAC